MASKISFKDIIRHNKNIIYEDQLEYNHVKNIWEKPFSPHPL